MPKAKSWAIEEVYGKQRKQFMNDIDLLLGLPSFFVTVNKQANVWESYLPCWISAFL